VLTELLILLSAFTILLYIRRTSRALSRRITETHNRLKKLERENRELQGQLGRAENSLNLSIVPSLSNRDWSFTLSFTTHGARLNSLSKVLDSISKQVLQPSKVILALTDSDKDLLTDQQRKFLDDHSVSIVISRDLGPGKKLIPALRNQSQPIIVIDDDIALPSDLTLQLMTQHHLYKDSIIASRAHRIIRDESGALLPYARWEKHVSINGPAKDLFATSGAGTLFPIGSLHLDALDEDLYSKLAFHTDDLWWHVHARRKGTLTRRIPGARDLEFIEDTQTSGLWNTGNKERNDENVAKLIAAFGDVF
jgi:hypothetical protein